MNGVSGRYAQKHAVLYITSAEQELVTALRQNTEELIAMRMGLLMLKQCHVQVCKVLNAHNHFKLRINYHLFSMLKLTQLLFAL